MRGGTQIAGDRPSAVVAAVSWLRLRRKLCLTVALFGLVAILVVDLLVPGYAVAAGYLVLVVFAAIALPQSTAIVIGAVGLVLTLAVMALQGRVDGENLLLVWFGVLAGAGLFALVSLYDSVEDLYTEQRERLERESFLVRLVDALLPLDDPLEVEETTVRLLAEQLAAGQTAFFEVDEAGRLVERRGYAREDSSARPDLGAFTAELAAVADSRALVLPAAATEGSLTELQRAGLDATGTGSWLASPIFEGGKLVAAVGAWGPAPREWTETEAPFLEGIVVRAWAEVRRARADAALRATEASLRDTLDSAVDGLYRLNVRTRRFDYISPSAAAITGVPLEELRKMDGPLAATSIHPDDRAEAARAAAGLERDGVAGLECRWAVRGTYRWYSGVMRLTRGEDGEPLFRTGTFRDVTAHKRREQNAAFVSELQDELAQVTSAQDVIDATGSRLGTYLGVALVSLTQIDPERDTGTVYVMWRDRQGATPPTDLRLADFVNGQVLADLRAGQTVVCRDVESDPRASSGAHGDVGVRSWVSVPFRRDGELMFAFSVNDQQPRDWRDDEIELLHDIAVRVVPRLERARAEEALAFEAARLRAIVEAAPVGIGIVAADGSVIMRNDILRSMWVGEAPVRSIDDFEAYRAYWPETGELLKPEEWPAAQALQHGESSADVVVDIDRFDDTRGTIVLSTAPIEDDGVILGAVTIVQDITRVREAEKALRFLTDEVRTLHEAVVLDPTASGAELARIVVAQGGLLAGSDGSSIFLLGEDGSLRRIAGIGVPDGEEIDDIVAQTIGDQSAIVRPLLSAGPEDAESPGRIVLAVPLMIRREVFGAMAFTYGNRRSLDDNQVRIARAFSIASAAWSANARLRARIEEAAIEAERTRLARDLHDSVTQSLFAASLKAEVLADLLDDRQQALGAVEELRRLTRGSLAGMRTMLLEMRGDALEKTPLPELLRHLVEASGGRIGADVRLTARGRRQLLPPDVQTAMYRIAQEALNNVARHAKASEVWVDLRQDDDDVRLEIGDDGRGFDLGSTSADHFGLQNMRERAHAIGAALTISGGAGSGTVVTVEWPAREGGEERG